MSSYALMIEGDDPPWDDILELLEDLQNHFPSPFVSLRRAVVLGHWDGPEPALRELHRLGAYPHIRAHLYYHCALAQFHAAMGNRRDAIDSLDRATSLARAESERHYLADRRSAIIAAG